MRPIVAALALLACALGGGAGAAERVDLELVLLADASRSIDDEEIRFQRRHYAAAITHADVLAAIARGYDRRIAVTYVEWGGDRYQVTRVGWTEIADAASAAAFAAAVEGSGVMLVEWTSISGAIAFGARSFEGNGFRGERRVIDISGDGPNNSGAYVNLARDRAVADGIAINGLPIVNDRPNLYGYPPFPDLDLYYEDCVIGGPGAFVVVADGFRDFARAILRKLVTEIAGRPPPRRLLRPAAERPRPPCDAGEIQLMDWLQRRGWPAPLDDF